MDFQHLKHYRPELLLVFSIFVFLVSISTLVLFITHGIEPTMTRQPDVKSARDTKPLVEQTINLEEGETKEISLDSEYIAYDSLPQIGSIKQGKLVLDGTLQVYGSYTLPLSSPTTEYVFTVNITPKPLPVDAIKARISQEIGDEIRNVSYYIHDTNREQSITWQETEVFIPASITKIPYALLLLRDIDSGTRSLDDVFPVSDGLKAYPTDEMYSLPAGTQLTLQDYLEYLIKYSDNTAMTHLEYVLGGYTQVQTRIKEELDIESFFRDPSEGTAHDAFKLLHNIYNEVYVTSSSNLLLIELMSDSLPRYDNRIVAGSPKNAQVAHKIGNLVSENGLVVNDAGIVFGEHNDIIIVVMTKDMINETRGSEIIETITSIATSELN
jgi:beta-lactamase class A